MWAFCFAAAYSGEFAALPGTMLADASPPWQSVQPSATVFVGCMVGSSVCEWQVTQPADLRSASSHDWPRSRSASSCGKAEWPLIPAATQTTATATHPMTKGAVLERV